MPRSLRRTFTTDCRPTLVKSRVFAQGGAPWETACQHAPHGCRVSWCMCFVIVIEINPGSFCAACLDPLGPFLEFRIRIIVPVPAGGAVQAQIDVVGCPDQLVRKSRAATRAEDCAGLANAAYTVSFHQ